MRHGPDPDDPARCRATDLLVTDCAGCRGSGTSLVDALQAHGRTWAETRDWGSDPYPADDDPAQVHGNVTMRPVRDPYWLNTGRPENVVADSKPFRANFGGGRCQRCPNPIKEGQMLVHTNMGGYAHAECLS